MTEASTGSRKVGNKGNTSSVSKIYLRLADQTKRGSSSVPVRLSISTYNLWCTASFVPRATKRCSQKKNKWKANFIYQVNLPNATIVCVSNRFHIHDDIHVEIIQEKTAEIASAFFTKQQAVETATEEGEPPLWQARCKNWAVFSWHFDI